MKLANVVNAKIEVNLYYRSHERELAIKRLLERAGAKYILGIGESASEKIPELGSERRRVDPNGIFSADVVLIPLEDGDRTEALVKMGKKTIAIDLNPLSRTAQKATITIVDNIIRAIPRLVETAEKLKNNLKKCHEISQNFDNQRNLNKSLKNIEMRLSALSKP